MDKKVFVIGTILLVSITLFLLLNTTIKKDVETRDSFNITKKEFMSGNYTKIFDIPEEYYRRSEFYPSYDIYKKSNQTMNAVYGYGAYPGDVSGNIEKFDMGNHINFYTLVYSSFGVYSFQGFGLTLKSHNDELFDTYVEPSDILFIPFSYNITDKNLSWVYKIKMTITAKKNIPKGEYIFKLKVVQPSPENDSKFYNITKNYNVSNKYMTAGMIEPSRFFDFILKVNN